MEKEFKYVDEGAKKIAHFGATVLILGIVFFSMTLFTLGLFIFLIGKLGDRSQV
jgi:hypothetical protein